MVSRTGPIRDEETSFREILAGVQKPTRYIGGEWNEIVKDHRDVALTFALAFPDVYEIGMSHLGFRILYPLLNSRDDVAAERVFCPWPDMADALRRHNRPLATLETGTPLGAMDVVGFSLQYEMTFTNVLEMLDLAGVPLRASMRGEADPLVVAGGPVVFNCEPIADFLDFVFVGDAEELLPEFLDTLKALKRARAPRAERIHELAKIPGIYAPALYDLEDDHGLAIPVGNGRAPYPVKRRIVYDIDRFPFPDRIIVPHGEIVHDRVSIELMRGCPVGCRFCQAGYIYRPTRERSPNQVRDTVIRSVRATGYDQFSLASLNTGEYGAVQPLLFDLMDRFEPESVSVSLSSLHASTMTEDLARQIRRVRKSGFTIAPEAGTQRLRNVINKNLNEEQILNACRLAFEAGWDLIKLYFMIGLPTETDADVDALVDLAHEIHALGRKTAKGRRPEVTLSASSFVPKAVTPFQWVGQDRLENLYRKQDRIASRVRRGVRFKHHECETTFLEGVFSRGDRKLSTVVERAFRLGARFDGWAEHFKLDIWQRAFREEGLDPERYAYGDWPTDRRLPWDVLDSLVNKKWLGLELKRALAEATLSICGPSDCHGCAPFARECVNGIVKETTGRSLDGGLTILATPSSPGPGVPARAADAPRALTTDEAAALRTALGELPRHRYRLRFEKTGRLQFLGHLDLTRAMLRAFRRARIALVYSQGFNPKPRVQFGPALSVGIESHGEYLDLWSFVRFDESSSVAAINSALPRGLAVTALRELDSAAPGLSESVRAAHYLVRLPNGLSSSTALASFAAREAHSASRKKDGKTVDFPLHVWLLEVGAVDETSFRMVLGAGGDGASVRPDEVLTVMFGDRAKDIRLVREDLAVLWGDRLVNPMLVESAACRLPNELLVSRMGGRMATALREDGCTVELRIEDDRSTLGVGDIIKARVTKILPGIQSAFLDVGQERDAFLHATDLLLPGDAAPPPVEGLVGEAPDDSEDVAEGETEGFAIRRPARATPTGPPIQDRLKEGRELVVQVVREALGGKGPRVTCLVTLPGRYLVHVPQAAFRGVSRRIHDPEERRRLRDILSTLAAASGGFIVRTAGAGAAAEAFEADARLLARTWETIEENIRRSIAPAVVYSDLDLFLRSLRDAPTSSLDRIIVDDAGVYGEGLEYLQDLDPILASRLRRHVGPESLFDATGVAEDVERALRPRVWLKSGGTIVIEQTEALVSIDVNTGKFVGSRRPDETVLKTNLEAAEEIAHQLRLRDLGGIIVIDFIDMDRSEHKHQVIAALEVALQRDRSRTKIVGLSELGLLQLTRKRTRLGLTATMTRSCGSCAGTGRMKTPETVAYDALSEVRRVGSSFTAGEITIRTHPEVARALRLALQTTAPVVDRRLSERLRVIEDPQARPDGFDVNAC